MVNQYSTVQNYTILRKLGKGGQAKVKLAKITGDDSEKYYAIKIFKRSNQDFVKNEQLLVKEVEIMKNLKHQNLIECIEYFPNTVYNKKNGEKYEAFVIILEYAEKGDTFYHISRSKFNEPVVRNLFKQLIDGLVYLQQQGISHRDLKPQNILLDRDFNLKIADFGFSVSMGKNFSGQLHTVLGTPGYMAPELYIQQYVGSQVDIFAAGVILFMWYSQLRPFRSGNPNKECMYFKLLADQKFDQFWKIHSDDKQEKFYTDEFKDLINHMLSFQPSLRITLAEIKSHPWYVQCLESAPNPLKDLEEQLKQKQIEQRLQAKNTNPNQSKQFQLLIGQNNKFVGNRAYRSSNDSSKFKGLDKIYKSLGNKNRKMKQLIGPQQSYDIVTELDKDHIFRSLLFQYSSFCSEKIDISDQEYKMFCKCKDKNHELLEIQIQFLKIDEANICLEIKKIQGNEIEYFKKLHQIQNIVENIQS